MDNKKLKEKLTKNGLPSESEHIIQNREETIRRQQQIAMLDKYDTKVTKLYGMLSTVDSFTNKDGFTVGDIDVKLLDNTMQPLKAVPISGYPETKTKPNPLSMFTITWQQPTGDLSNFTLPGLLRDANNKGQLHAVYIGAYDEFKTSIKAKQTMVAAEDAAKKVLKTPGNMNSSEENKLDDCIKLAPKSMKEALEEMAKTDDKTAVYGNRQDETAIIIKDGKIVFSAPPKSAPVNEASVKIDSKGITAAKVNTKGTRIKTAQEVTGLDSSRMPGEDFMPAGTIFTPRLNRIPGMDLIETVIVLADAAKLVYDFFDAYNQGQK